jgi:uncharacterized protein DUF6894
MPRYFFHLADGTGVFRDDIGEEFGNIEEARSHAVQIVRELGRSRPKHVIARLRLLVTDDAGVTLYSIPLLLDRV